jgi:hypothetical protein
VKLAIELATTVHLGLAHLGRDGGTAVERLARAASPPASALARDGGPMRTVNQ